MALRDRYITFEGTNLKTEYGLQYSSFEEELPKPKVIKVEIPAGLDLDITDSLGVLGYHNGKHTLKFLLYGETQAERLEKKQAIIAKLHGRRANYTLSWDSGYTYTGRATVKVQHLFENADLITVEIDRNPWKVGAVEYVDVNSHPSSSHTLTGSSRYHSVKAVMRQAGTTKVGLDTPVSRLVGGTYDLASDLYEDTEITITVSDWLFYIDGTDLVVNPSHVAEAIGSTDYTIDSIYTVTDGDMNFPAEKDQYTRIRYFRYDL